MAESVHDRKLGISAADRSFMRVGNFTFRVRQGEFGPEPEEGDDRRVFTEAADLQVKPLWLGFIKQRKKVYVELTGMTGDELALFKRAMEEAIAAAEQVVAWLDQTAVAEYSDDTPMIPLRALRGPPVGIVRPIRPFLGHPLDEAEPGDAIGG